LYRKFDFLDNREQEIWKPLFALCQVFAPHRIHELERSAADIAALKTKPVRRFEQLKAEEERIQKLEYTERLLRDSLAVMGERDRITSADLVRGLRDIPTSPWRSYEGTGITDISLAAMLKLFDVEPKTIRFRPKTEPNSTAKGYYREPLDRALRKNQAEPEDAGRNPVTPSDDVPKKTAAALRVLPPPSMCGGCKDMHRGIADNGLVDGLADIRALRQVQQVREPGAVGDVKDALRLIISLANLAATGALLTEPPLCLRELLVGIPQEDEPQNRDRILGRFEFGIRPEVVCSVPKTLFQFRVVIGH